MVSRILDAAQRNLPPCPKCHSLRGDPCRTPRGRPTKAHRERERYRKELIMVKERNEGRSG